MFLSKGQDPREQLHLNVIDAPFHHFISVILRVLQSMTLLRQAPESALEACLASWLGSLLCHVCQPKASAWHVPMEPDKDRAGKQQNQDDEESSRFESPLLNLQRARRCHFNNAISL